VVRSCGLYLLVGLLVATQEVKPRRKTEDRSIMQWDQQGMNSRRLGFVDLYNRDVRTGSSFIVTCPCLLPEYSAT